MVKKRIFKIIWDSHALDGFKEILNFLSKQSTQAPKIVKEGVLAKLSTIKTNSFICEADKLKGNGDGNFRAAIVYSYRITYQVNIEAGEIRILRIRHTSREPFGY